MAKYGHVNKLTKVEAAYIAGIVDGEGTITLTRRNSYKQRHVVLTVSNNELILLRYILKTIGVGKITIKNVRSIKHSLGYTYQISNRLALDVIRYVYPFLRTHKRLRAQLVLQKYLALTPRNGKYTPKMLLKREKFVEKFFTLIPKHKSP